MEVSDTYLDPTAGLHSYTLILPILSRQSPGLVSHLPSFTSAHEHDHEVDIRASYFALLSIVVKETLYRITYRVGKAEDSKVLMANALHHRSDAFSSFVALLAIVSYNHHSFYSPESSYENKILVIKRC